VGEGSDMAKKNQSAESSAPSYFSSLKKIKTGNELADSGKKLVIADYTDTGSLILNVGLTGDLTKGIPSGKVIMLAGEKQTGKTFIAAYCYCRPLQNKGYFIFWIDTENAMDDDRLAGYGLNPDGFRIIKENIAEQVRFQVNTILDEIEELKKKDPNLKAAIVLDSQGQMSTMKAVSDTEKGEKKQDYTKQKELKTFYNLTTHRLGVLDVPMLVTNHVYADVNNPFAGNTKVISGGEGGMFSAEIIFYCRKFAHKDGKSGPKTGIIFEMTLFKNRFCEEGKKIRMYLDRNTGPNRYYGIHLLAEEAGIIEEWDEKKHEKKGLKLPEKIDKKDRKAYVIKIGTEVVNWKVVWDKFVYTPEITDAISEDLQRWLDKAFKLINPINFLKENPDYVDGIDLSEKEVEDAAAYTDELEVEAGKKVDSKKSKR
jgi:RecA/RadA recombinase